MATVLITGANRGIGCATALTVARAGHQVFAALRHPDQAEVLAAAVREEQLAVELVVMDVDRDDSVVRGVEQVQQHGPIDVLVNNAGIERRGSVEEMPLADIRAVMETNFFGPVRCMQAVLPAMRARGSGCIVNITSIASQVCGAPLGAYSASKSALECISEALAQEVTPFGVRVAVVLPGIIDTDMSRAVTSGTGASLYPHGRRFAGLFTASLQSPRPPDIVANAILAIIEGDSAEFRYPVGPDAAPFLGWRASLTDRQWIEWGAMSDDEWYAAVERDFGMNARLGSTAT